MSREGVGPVPDAWTSSEDSERSPGAGPGFVLLLLVIGVVLLAFAAGAVLVVMDLARTVTGLQ